MHDGTAFTLRPGTAFVLERFELAAAGAEAAWFRLLRGGVRAVTGMIARRQPEAFALHTPTASIGVRGTRFDARLCGEDCRDAARAPVPGGAGAVALPVVARAVQLSGVATAFTQDRVSRPLAMGGALFEGEEVRTGVGTVLVLAFRDHSVVSVAPATVLRISAFSWEQPQRSSNVALDLLRGGLRVLTGSVGKQSPEAVKIKTATSVIGIRGTGMDIICEGPCIDPSLVLEAGGEPASASARHQQAGGSSEPGSQVAARPEDGLFMRTWDGLPYFERGPLDVPLDRVGHIGGDGLPRVLREVPAFLDALPVARPDRVPIEWDRVFGATDPGGADGLYVGVRQGHVVLQSGNRRLDLAAGETGWSGTPGQAERTREAPSFLSDDATPEPDADIPESPITQLFQIRQATGSDICYR
nr:FecR domain-containing protein [Ramlibacter aurantiacus]